LALNSSIISIGDIKESALFFERVFPFDGGSAFIENSGWTNLQPFVKNSIPYSEGSWDLPVLENLMGSQVDYTKFYGHHISWVMTLIFLFECEDEIQKGEDFSKTNEKLDSVSKLANRIGLDLKLAVNEIRDANSSASAESLMSPKLDEILSNSGFASAPEWVSQQDFSEIENHQSPQTSKLLTTIKNIKLVDPDKANWDQIIELRKDKQSFHKIRSVRKFFDENYSDKSLAFIEDDLADKIYQHTQIAKLWGLETTLRSLNALISKDNLLPSSVAGVIALTTGVPISAAAAVSAVIPLGAASLEIGKSVVEKRRISIGNGIEYFADVKDQFE